MIKKIKIAFILNHLNAGGAERIVVTLANELSKRSHDVSIIVTKKYGSYLLDVSPDVKIVHLSGGRMLFAIASLAQVINRNSYDVVIAGLDQPNVALGIVRYFINKKTICIATEHNHPLHSEKNIKGFTWKAIRKLKIYVYPRLDHIITVNSEIKNILVKFFKCHPENVTTLYNPVNIKKVEDGAAQAPTHPWLISKDSTTFLAAGRLSGAKDYENLLHAFKIVRGRMPAKLIVIGEGALRADLESLRANLALDDYVDFPGFCKNPYAEMANADCFVMSSKNEGLPTVLIEALAVGARIISTNCPSGPAEILSNSKYGTLVPVSDPQSLANAMLKFGEKEHDTSQCKLRALSFSTSDTIDKYEDLLERLIN